MHRLQSIMYFLQLLLLSAFAPRLGATTDDGRLLRVTVPPMTVYADRLEQGDCDLYGRGDWQVTVRATVQGDCVVLQGRLLFQENAGDNTRITGKFKKVLPLPEGPGRKPWCAYRLREHTGAVRGKNTGPVGPQSKKGEGLIESADIVSDTWGCEPGEVGGRVRFRDIEVECFCDVAGL